MHETWKGLLHEIEVGPLPQDSEWLIVSDRYPLGKKIRLFLEETSLDMFTTCVEEIVERCKNVPQIADDTFFNEDVSSRTVQMVP
jgi:hypothetical protein